MSTKIRIPKSAVMASQSKAASKRRKAPSYTDDESDEEDEFDAGPSKRVRTEESTEDRDVDVDGENDEDEGGQPVIDTRFLPPPENAPTNSRSKRSTKKPPRRSVVKKRAVILSDEEDEDEYNGDGAVGSDDDFVLEASTKKELTGKAKGRAVSGAKATRKEEREISVRDERRFAPPPDTSSATKGILRGKRPRVAEDEDVDIENTSKADSSFAEPIPEKEPTPPPKKRKLPTIKKNKPSTAGSSTVSVPLTKLVPKSGPETKPPAGDGLVDITLPRKPNAAMNNADFDLRDKSVYASLFTKPGGSTPNSGLNRKEKEEQRRRELNKMRDDARRSREEEAKSTFNLQSAQEKIHRFEEKLHSRRSMAVFHNILGAAFKDVLDKSKRAAAKDNVRT